MAATGGVVSRSPCQCLLRAVARPRARSWLLVPRSRWMSCEKQARPDQRASLRPEYVRWRDQELLKDFGEPFKTIDQRSIAACKEPVRLVGSKIECLCSWNDASGPRQAIYVPGDARRPRKTRPSLSDPATRASLAPMRNKRPNGSCNLRRLPRIVHWDDCLAALCATDPEMKLDHVDVMISDRMMIILMMAAQNGAAPFFGRPILRPPKSEPFNLLLSGNTLVMKQYSLPERLDTWGVTHPMLPQAEWEFYKAATELAPGVEDFSFHHQLLRYNIGPLSCLVKVRVHGTVQEMPTSACPSEASQARNVHGIDVVKAGQGVHPASAFTAIPRQISQQRTSDSKRLKAYTARLWLAGQTRLGIANVVPEDQVEELGGLTVVDMAELVRHFEGMNQEGLRRLVGLLTALRDAVRARGAPCVGKIFPPTKKAGGTMPGQDYTVQVYGAGPDEVPVLLDWHKEHFWSQNKAPSKQAQTRRKATGKATKGQSQPQEKVNDEHVHAPKGSIRKWVQWLGF